MGTSFPARMPGNVSHGAGCTGGSTQWRARRGFIRLQHILCGSATNRKRMHTSDGEGCQGQERVLRFTLVEKAMRSMVAPISDEEVCIRACARAVAALDAPAQPSHPL